MIELWRQNGGAPAPLPFRALDANNRSWTNLANNPEGRNACGFQIFGSYDPATQRVVSNGAGGYVIEAIPPVVTPPAPVDPFAGFIPIHMIRQRAEKLGIFSNLAAYLVQYPDLNLKLTTLENGMVDPAYPDLLEGLDDMNVPAAVRAYLLMDPSMGVPDVPTG